MITWKKVFANDSDTENFGETFPLNLTMSRFMETFVMFRFFIPVSSITCHPVNKFKIRSHLVKMA